MVVCPKWAVEVEADSQTEEAAVACQMSDDAGGGVVEVGVLRIAEEVGARD